MYDLIDRENVRLSEFWKFRKFHVMRFFGIKVNVFLRGPLNLSEMKKMNYYYPLQGSLRWKFRGGELAKNPPFQRGGALQNNCL